MKKKVTLKELAEKMNVSVSTVSKALNDSPEISEQRKKKIKEVAELLDYTPNIIAQQLKRGKTNTIGVIIPSIQNNFFVQVLDGIESKLRDTSYNIIISVSKESLDIERTVCQTYSNGIADGVIIAIAEGSQKADDIKHISSLQNSIPVVLFDRTTTKLDCDQIYVDDHDAAFNATSNLVQKGKRNVALVSTIQESSVGQSRIQGYKDALENNHISRNEKLICFSEISNLESDVKKLLKTNPIDAIITLDEESSLAVYNTINRGSSYFFDSIAVIGYMNEQLASQMTPSFSTINQHGVTIGETVANVLLEKLKVPNSRTQHKSITSSINYRDTSS